MYYLSVRAKIQLPQYIKTQLYLTAASVLKMKLLC